MSTQTTLQHVLWLESRRILRMEALYVRAANEERVRALLCLVQSAPSRAEVKIHFGTGKSGSVLRSVHGAQSIPRKLDLGKDD